VCVSSQTRKAIAEAIAAVARMSLPTGQWPQLLPSVVQLLGDAGNVDARRSSMRILLSLTEEIGELLAEKFAELVPVLQQGMSDADLDVRVYALHATGSIIAEVESEDDGALVRSLMPPMMSVVEACLAAGLEEDTCAALEPLATLVDSSLRLLEGDALPQLLGFMLRLFNSPLPSQIRATALGIAEYVTRSEVKRAVKLGLVEPLVDSVFQLIAEAPAEEDEEDLYDAMGNYRMGISMLDQLCVEIPMQVVLPLCVSHVQAFASGTPLQRRAALGALSVMCEGCGEAMAEQLQEILPMVLSHVQHGEAMVRLAAFVCVAKFSTFLVPNILDHTDEVLPVLLNGLHEKAHDVRDACLFALREFVDTLSPEDTAKWTGPVSEQLLTMMQQVAGDDHAAHELLMTSICACCNIGQEHFMPYIEPTLQIVYSAMQLSDDDPNLIGFRAQATETASIVCCVLGRERAEPHIGPLFELAFAGMELGDHELCAATHQFFGNMASLLKADYAPLLPRVIGYMITALAMETPKFEGDMAHSDSEDDGDDFDGGADFVDEDGNAIGARGILLHQTSAARNIGPLAVHSGAAFAPHLEPSIKALVITVVQNYPDLRSESLTSLCQFVLYLHRMMPPSKPWSKGSAADNPINADCMAIAKLVTPLVVAAIISDNVRENACKAAIALRELVEELGPALAEDYNVRILHAIGVVMKGKGACQVARDAHDESDDLESGRDIELFDACWDVLIALARCLGPAFEPFLRTSLLAPLLKFVHPKYPPAFGGLALGALHDIYSAIGGDMSAAANTLIDACIVGMQNDYDTFKVNAAVLVGLTVQWGGAPAAARALDVLQYIHPFFAYPEHGISVLAFDNACGAVGRIVGTLATHALPWSHLLPVWLGALPVREDVDERNNALRGLLSLAEQNGAVLLPHAGDVARVAAYELTNDTVVDEVKDGLAQLVRALSQQADANGLIQQAAAALPDDRRAVLQQCLR
jgi:importin-4